MCTYTVWHFWPELALELSPEILTSTLRVWRTLHTEGMYPYHMHRVQRLEPADMCSPLEMCRWINFNPHVIRNILFADEAHTRWTRDKNFSSEFSALQEASTTLQRFVRLRVLWSHESENYPSRRRTLRTTCLSAERPICNCTFNSTAQ